MFFSVGMYKYRERCGVCVCLCLEDFICDCAYSVMNNVHKVVLSSKQVVSEVVMHLFWLSNRSAGVFLLPI